MPLTLLELGRKSNQRAFWLLAVSAQAWIACGGVESSPTVDPTPSAGAAVGGAADEGSGGRKANHAGASGMLNSDQAAGASAGGSAGVGGLEEASGAGGAIDDAAAGASGTSSVDFVAAPHAPFPLVVKHSGPLLETIELVPVYFGDDPLHADLERFNSWIVTSDYWKQTGAEYGVKPGTRLPAVQFESLGPGVLSDAQIASWLDAHVADGSLPKPSANTLFALFYQSGTTITSGSATSCVEFAGLHDSVRVANARFTGDVAFAIIPRCSYSTGDELMIATDVASHEYVESATTPQPFSNATWFMENYSGPLEAWLMLGGPAVTDLCQNQSYDLIDGFRVQDIWSNAAAQSGNNPCQPSDPNHPFFSVSADETIYHASPGTTLTIQARAWSNKPAPDWELGVNWGWVPDSDFDGQATLSATVVNNGDELTATVTIPAHPPVVGGRSVYRFTIDSLDPINPNFAHPWPFLVIVP